MGSSQRGRRTTWHVESVAQVVRAFFPGSMWRQRKYVTGISDKISIIVPPEILSIQPDDPKSLSQPFQVGSSSGTSTPVSQFEGEKMQRGSEEYKMAMREGSVRNTYAFVEGRDIGQGVIAPPTLLGQIVHDCSVEVTHASETYRQLLRQRVMASAPKRKTMKLDLTQDQSSRLTSGATMGRQNQDFGDFALSQKQKHTNGDIRNARIPRNELLDQLFACFNQREAYTIKELREKLRQPEAWLKEVLSQIAVLSKKGDTTNQWVLKEAFKGLGENQKREVKEKLEEEARLNPDSMMNDETAGTGESDDDDDYDIDMEEVPAS
ncbi:hypothetical protein BT69DRAFT_1283859 [Atractiella rhizophila]|nr:hypothetical protein BT69DRAFT_1283859 [Atractiella rhizophila]